MTPKSPKTASLFSGNGCAGVFLIVVGLGLAAIPFQDGVPLGLFHVFYPTLSFLLFELVGIAFLAGGGRALLFSRSFSTPAVEVSPDIRLGEPFEFHYKQPVRRSLAVRAIDTFFVYREKVTRGDKTRGGAHYFFDRLIERQSLPARSYSAGEEIDIHCAFRVPAGEMGIRNPYMHIRGIKWECRWVVRVRVLFDRSSETWEDREIEVGKSQPAGVVDQDVAPEAGLFDVLLLPIPWENTVAVSNALKEVAPQLAHSGVPYAQQEAANLIRERVGQVEAEAIAGPLRAAGATVNIVPTEATWRLPATQEEQAQPGGAANLSS